MGNGHAMKNQLVIKCIMKAKVWRHIRQKYRNIHSDQCLLCPFGHDEEYGILKHLIAKHNEWHPKYGVVVVIFCFPRRTKRLNIKSCVATN